jgi:hypothetical protein
MFSKADTHIHTTYSDGLMTPEETIDYIATHTDLRVIAITDHDTAEGAFVAQAHAQRYASHLAVIVGQEVTTGDGDIVGLFLSKTLPPFDTAAEAIQAIHSQLGLAVAVHPFSRWNTFNNMNGVGSKIFSLPFDAIEARNGFPANLISNPLTIWLNRTSGQGLPELGGSDSHVPFTVGQNCTYFPGETAADLRRAIAHNQVRAGGSLWTPASLARMLPVLLRRGFPNHVHVPQINDI